MNINGDTNWREFSLLRGATVLIGTHKPAPGKRTAALKSGKTEVSEPARQPSQGNRVPLRSIRIPDDLWNAAKAKSSSEGTSVAAVINGLLAEWVAL